MGNCGSDTDPLVQGFNSCNQGSGIPLHIAICKQGKGPLAEGAFGFALYLFCSQGSHPEKCRQQFLSSSSSLQLRGEKKWEWHAKIPGFAFGQVFHRSAPDVEPCAWMFPSSPADDIVWCHEGAFLSSWWQWWVLAGSSSEGSRCWLRAAHLWARVPLATITLLHLPLNLNEHLGMSGADGIRWLLGSFLFWDMTSSSFSPSPFMFTQCFTLISPAHIYLPGRVTEQHPGSLQGFCGIWYCWAVNAGRGSMCG